MSRDPWVRCVSCGRPSVVARQREDGRCWRCAALHPCEGSVHAACDQPATTTLTLGGAETYACPAHAIPLGRKGWTPKEAPRAS